MGMTQSPESDFDFEEWALLAKTDPAAFEAKRKEAIAQLIAGATPRMQERLRGLQWRIDMDRSRASNPLASCMQMFNKMWASVYDKGGLQDALHGLDCRPVPENEGATVVKLERKRTAREDILSYP